MIKVGIMGFGHIGRYIFSKMDKDSQFSVNAICDIGNPDILKYLLESESRNNCKVDVNGNYFITQSNKTRFINAVSPGDIPWDALDVDWVIDASGKYLSALALQKHLDAGAKKVILTSLPDDNIDRIVIPGINENDINKNDKIISAGSSTTNALAILLNILDNAFKINFANMMTIHSYTSEQPLQDMAWVDFRRSRSAAENIIPNKNKSADIIQEIIPKFKNKIMSSALNVPVQFGSMLDLTTVFESNKITVDDVNNLLIKESNKFPELIKTVEDPIVSSDVIGMSETIVFDLKGTLKIGENMIKTLSWYDNGFNHASRVIDVILAYNQLEKK
ncbi:MAG: glyceraldehyde-3-phosphate dehydrogenase [Candidatus Marinimicrobia bacterium]|nr:glyceraldehyde-3-phosphate dehydrogenase [Candidatus Neomarinimicrobiota bacterium]